MALASKPVTKTVLSSFVRENTALNLTQSKALTDQLLDQYSVTVKLPTDPSSIHIEVGQEWFHAASERTLRVTGVEVGPQYVQNDPVTIWGPKNISWTDTRNPDITGVTQTADWHQDTRQVVAPEIDADEPASAPSGFDSPPESSDQP